jgi:hypothetical protein
MERWLYAAREFERWILVFRWDGGTEVLWRPTRCRGWHGRFVVRAGYLFIPEALDEIVDEYLARVDRGWLAREVAAFGDR